MPSHNYQAKRALRCCQVAEEVESRPTLSVNLRGKILVAKYGKCDGKLQKTAEDAGAAGLILINGWPWTHGMPGDWSDTGIPVVMVSSEYHAVFDANAGEISITSSKRVPHLAWWWFVAAGDSASFKLNSSTFENTAFQVLEASLSSRGPI